MKTLSKGALLLSAIFFTGTTMAGDDLRSLENMERERSVLIENFLDVSLTAVEREKKVEFARRRLMGLERLVIRDERLLGSSSPLVRKTFADYDLSFLVHASVESRRQIFDHWLAQLGLSTDSILNSQRVRK